MSTVIEKSTISSKNQTTIPRAVRLALDLSQGTEIAYEIHPSGLSVTIRRADAEHHDPALKPFLKFLARDIERNPGQLHPLDETLVREVFELVDGVDVDLDAPLDDEE